MILIIIEIGDFVKEGDFLIDVQTEKTNVEIRTDKAGKITNIFAKEGDTVKIKQNLIEIDTDAVNNSPKVEVKKEEKQEKVVEKKEEKKEEVIEKKVDKKIDIQKVEINNSPFEVIHETSNTATMSPIRELINLKMKDIMNEKAVLSTFNEVRILF